MSERYSVIVTAPGGRFDVAQAESRKEAEEMRAYAKKKYPTVQVKIRKSESGLAIFDGYMSELLK